jgi:hypothetical protein
MTCSKHTILAAVDAHLKFVTSSYCNALTFFWFKSELKGLYIAVHQAQISNDSQCLHRMALEAASRFLSQLLDTMTH